MGYRDLDLGTPDTAGKAHRLLPRRLLVEVRRTCVGISRAELYGHERTLPRERERGFSSLGATTECLGPSCGWSSPLASESVFFLFFFGSFIASLFCRRSDNRRLCSPAALVHAVGGRFKRLNPLEFQQISFSLTTVEANWRSNLFPNSRDQ